MNKTSRKFILGRRYHVVIVGANFAGLKAASGFSEDFKVTVIDPHPYFEFLPNIHELISGVKKPSHLRLPRKSIIEGFGHRFIKDSVERIDCKKNKVHTCNGKRLYFDFCIIAVGGINNTLGIEGAAKFAMPFKSVEDCYRIGQKLKQLSKSVRRIHIVIVGGGLEGIEAMGEILRKYRQVSTLSIDIIEKSFRLLPGTFDSLDHEIRRLCQPFKVTFRTGTGVEKVTERTVYLSSKEKIPSDVTIWTGGSCAPPLIDKSDLNQHSGQWAPVHPSLQSHWFDHVFIAGDAAQLSVPVSKQSYYAMDMGLIAAKNIQHIINGDSPALFHPFYRPSVVTFGDLSTFLITDKFAAASSALAALKESIFQIAMLRMDKYDRFGGILDTVFRVNSAATGFAWPVLTSFSALKRLGQFKVLN